MARLQKIGSLAGALGEGEGARLGLRGSARLREVQRRSVEARADAVAHVLTQAGVEPGRIVIEAHGEQESTSAEGDLEGYAFERRVTVRIEQEGRTRRRSPATEVIAHGDRAPVEGALSRSAAGGGGQWASRWLLLGSRA